MKKHVMVLGADGMLGHRILARLLDYPDQFEVIGTVRKMAEAITHNKLFKKRQPRLLTWREIQYTGSIDQDIGIIKPNYVINCIGIIKQRTEDALNASHMIFANALFPHRIAHECKNVNAKLITFSSDCVFLGNKKGAYTILDQGDAHSLYGRTKYLGEINNGKALTLRTSFIGFEIKGYLSLLEWFMQAVRDQRKSGKEIYGYANAIWSGVSTKYIADWLIDRMIANTMPSGIKQMACEKKINKYQLLQLINKEFELKAKIKEDDDTYEIDKICNRELKASEHFEAPEWKHLVKDLKADYELYGKRDPATQ